MFNAPEPEPAEAFPNTTSDFRNNATLLTINISLFYRKNGLKLAECVILLQNWTFIVLLYVLFYVSAIPFP